VATSLSRSSRVLGKRVVWSEPFSACEGNASGCGDPADIWMAEGMRSGHVQEIFSQVYSGSESTGVYGNVSMVFPGIQCDNYTLDLDSSVLTRYGDQEGAERGYNPAKPGRNAHHPLDSVSCRLSDGGESMVTERQFSYGEQSILLYRGHIHQASVQEDWFVTGGQRFLWCKKTFSSFMILSRGLFVLILLQCSRGKA